MDKYTPHAISKHLRELNDDDLGVELRSIIPKLPEVDQRFIMLYAKGYSPQQAARELCMRGNPQRSFNNLIQTLTRKANGNG